MSCLGSYFLLQICRTEKKSKAFFDFINSLFSFYDKCIEIVRNCLCESPVFIHALFTQHKVQNLLSEYDSFNATVLRSLWICDLKPLESRFSHLTSFWLVRVSYLILLHVYSLYFFSSSQWPSTATWLHFLRPYLIEMGFSSKCESSEILHYPLCSKYRKSAKTTRRQTVELQWRKNAQK